MNDFMMPHLNQPKSLVEEIYAPALSTQAKPKTQTETKKPKLQANKEFARSLEASCDCV